MAQNLYREWFVEFSIYGGGRGAGERPVEDKAALIAGLQKALAEAATFCRAQGVELAAIEKVEGMRRLELLRDAVDALVATGEVKRRYFGLANGVKRLFDSVLPDARAQPFRARVKLLSVLDKMIRGLAPPPDISLTMKEVEALLDESIDAEGYAIGESGRYTTDLSRIDFEKLAGKFERSRKRTFNEKLTAALTRRVERMVRENPTRIDYLARLQAKIDAYNAGSANVEEHVRQLFEFAEELNEEDRRGLAEALDQGELAVFDILTRPRIDLTDAEREKVKATACSLLDTLKAGRLALDWRKKQQARADVRVTLLLAIAVYGPRPPLNRSHRPIHLA